MADRGGEMQQGGDENNNVNQNNDGDEQPVFRPRAVPISTNYQRPNLRRLEPANAEEPGPPLENDPQLEQPPENAEHPEQGQMVVEEPRLEPAIAEEAEQPPENAEHPEREQELRPELAAGVEREPGPMDVVEQPQSSTSNPKPLKELPGCAGLNPPGERKTSDSQSSADRSAESSQQNKPGPSRPKPKKHFTSGEEMETIPEDRESGDGSDMEKGNSSDEDDRGNASGSTANQTRAADNPLLNKFRKNFEKAREWWKDVNVIPFFRYTTECSDADRSSYSIPNSYVPPFGARTAFSKSKMTEDTNSVLVFSDLWKTNATPNSSASPPANRVQSEESTSASSVRNSSELSRSTHTAPPSPASSRSASRTCSPSRSESSVDFELHSMRDDSSDDEDHMDGGDDTTPDY